MDLSTKNAEFLGRMEVLNKNLLKFIFDSLKEFPGADLTPTINSYLKHIADLDKKYSEGQPTTTSTQPASNDQSKTATKKTTQPPTVVQPPTVKSIQPTVTATQSTSDAGKRKRILPPSDELRSFAGKKMKGDEEDVQPVEQKKDTNFAELSAPSNNFPNFFQPKDVEQTNVEQIPVAPTKMPNFFQPKNVEQKNDTSFEQAPPAKMPNFFQPKDAEPKKDSIFNQPPVTSTNLSFSSDASKKPEIGTSLFGGSNTSGGFSSLDNNKSVSFSSTDANKSLPSTETSKPSTFPGSNSLLNFSLFGNSNANGSKPESSSTTQSNQNGKEPTKSLFSTQPSAAASGNELPKSLFSTQPSADSEAKKESVPIFKFNQAGNDSLTNSSTQKTAANDDKSALFSGFQFGKNGTKPSESASTTQQSTSEPKASFCPPFQFNQNGTAPSTNPLFGQQNGTEQEAEKVVEKVAEQGTEQGADENEEPPKVEEVEQKEEGALFFMKTLVFTYKDKKWDKLGAGYVNVTPGDKDNCLLVRAATTLGTIWINTYIAEHFKAFLKGDKAMTIRFPDVDAEGKTSIVQFLFKGGDPEEFKKLAEFLNANILK